MMQCIKSVSLQRDKKLLDLTQIQEFMYKSWTKCPWPTQKSSDKMEKKPKTQQAEQQRFSSYLLEQSIAQAPPSARHRNPASPKK